MSEEEDSLVKALRAARSLPQDTPLEEKLEAIFYALLEVKGISYEVSKDKKVMHIKCINGYGEPSESTIALVSWPPDSKEMMFNVLQEVLEHVPDIN